jgi:hypothetical protein
LLYEKGTPLEDAVLEALDVLGFKAERFKEGGSEFDSVFTSPEGRFLGEAEGKDSKAINIEKLRQLSMNVHEDYEREEVTELAKGVLFGNAQRLEDLSARDQFFTEKCVREARRFGFALVRTPDLFIAAKHVRERGDEAFKKRCREALLNTEGGAVVVFPGAT